MNLTPRATTFLRQQERRTDSYHSPEVLAEAFSKAGLVPSAALQAFQRNYAGLVIYAGREPIHFGLVHAKVHNRWLRAPLTSYGLDLWEPDEDNTTRHFRCASTQYQEYFTLDDHGGYYEGGQRQASSFDGVVEDLAVYKEAWADGYRRQWLHVLEEAAHGLPTAVLCAALQVDPYPAFPEDLIFWGRNETLLVRQSPAELTLFARGPADPSAQRTCEKLLGLAPNDTK